MNIYIHYVYAYLRKDGTPYYIGKGKNGRAFHNHGKLPVPEDISRIVFLETNLSNIGALALERRYIQWYGRKDNNTGILRNLTDGGEGPSGVIRTVEHKQKLRDANKGKPSPKKGKKGKPLSEETKILLSAIRKGRPKSEKHKQNMRKPRKNPRSAEHSKKIWESRRNKKL
jgi:hypothetical protein